MKFLLLPGHVKRFGKVYYDDWHVWVVANALRRGLDVAPKSHLQARYEPAIGVFVDFVCGGIGTALICVALAEAGFGFRTELWQNAGLWKGVAMLGDYEVVMTIWEIARAQARRRRGRPSESRPRHARPGTVSAVVRRRDDPRRDSATTGRWPAA